MGWKVFFLVATTRKPHALTDSETHDPAFARRILSELPLPPHELVGPATFELGCYPNDDQLFIGAYSGTILIGHSALGGRCIESDWQPVLRGVQSVLPGADLAAFALHSVVNLYGYAIFRGMDRIRVRYGSDGEEYINEGELLPEEVELSKQSELRDGERIFKMEFDGQTFEQSESEMGEEFVFEVTKRYFGKRLDQFQSLHWPMEEFRLPKKPGLWSRLFGS
jgi:hypothetical protein